MPLPFVVPKTYGKNHTIEDETGIKLEIPKYGSLTWAEYMFWVDAERNTNLVEESKAAYTAKIVTGILRLRFNISPETTDIEILTTSEGKSLPESMVVALYEFFLSEMTRWKPAQTEDKEKKETAEN